MKKITVAIHKETKNMLSGHNGQYAMVNPHSLARSIGQGKVKRAEYDLVESVAVPVEKYKEMLERLEFLNCLEACGVDNWEGYSDAGQMMEEEEE